MSTYTESDTYTTLDELVQGEIVSAIDGDYSAAKVINLVRALYRDDMILYSEARNGYFLLKDTNDRLFRRLLATCKLSTFEYVS